MNHAYRIRAMYAARQEWLIRAWEPPTSAEAKIAVAAFVGSILLRWHNERSDLGL